MKNIISKTLIGLVTCIIAFGFGSVVNASENEGYTYDEGWKSWDINANILDNGDMQVIEKLVYFNDNYSLHRVSESLFGFDKGSSSNIDGFDISNLKEDSFTVSVYDQNETYFINQNVPSSNAEDSYKSDDCLGFSWIPGCKDERGYEIKKQNGLEKVFIYLHNGLKDGVTIEFKYTIENVVTKYADYSVLNWKFVGTYQDADVKNVSLTINLPDGGTILDDDISNSGFSKDHMTVMGFGTTNAKIASQNGKQVKVIAKKLYCDLDDEVEMFVSIPNEKVDLFPNIKFGDSNYSSNKGYEKLKNIIDTALDYEDSIYNPYQILEVAVIIVASLLLVINVLVLIHCFNKYDKELKSNFDFEFYREIPNESYSPSVASFLINEKKLTKDSLNGELMDLIRRKYIIVDINGQDLTSKKPNFILRLNEEKYSLNSDLSNSELYLLNWFFKVIGKDGVLSFDELDGYMNNHVNAERYNSCNLEWNEKVKENADNFDWFDEKNRAKKFSPLGLLSLLVSALMLGIVVNQNLSWVPILFASLVFGSGITILIYIPSIKRKTQLGIDEYTKWMAFKKFLQEFSHFEDYPIPSLIVWEHYMVYATMFGIADLVEKQLRTKFMDLNRVNEYDENVYFRYRVYRHVNYRVNHAVMLGNQAIAKEKARKSGSSGRRGGFGGGSSFGGGGRGGSFR